MLRRAIVVGRRVTAPARVFMSRGVDWLMLAMLGPVRSGRALIWKVQVSYGRQPSVIVSLIHRGGLTCSGHGGRYIAVERKQTHSEHKRELSCTRISRYTRISKRESGAVRRVRGPRRAMKPDVIGEWRKCNSTKSTTHARCKCCPTLTQGFHDEPDARSLGVVTRRKGPERRNNRAAHTNPKLI